MTFPYLFRKEIEGEFAQENFSRIADFFRDFPFANLECKFFEFDIPGGVTDFRFVHNLGFMPKDVIVTGYTGSPSITWNFDRFDKTAVYVTSTTTTKVRCLIGRYN